MTRRARATSLATFAAAAAALLLALASPARAQVSPGPLAAPHAALDGATQCFQCHEAGNSKKGIDARCLACHGEIAWMRTAGRGTHARLKSQTCTGCHPDHGGRSFDLIVWDGGSPEKFDHAKAGYVLQGKHAAQACRACHKPEFQRSPAAKLIRKKNRATSWLGLETACASCHADPHHGQLGADCARCHDVNAWKPARGFDHARTAYPLTGAHATVECAKCHLAPKLATATDAQGKPLAQWKPLPHADCVACHADPHAGRFKGACASCHNTSGWKNVRASSFNHDVTRYPLRGKHTAVACADCHDARRAFGAKPKFARCMDCHKDAHAGTATLLGEVVDCATCHSVDGYDRPAYGVSQHAKAKFALLGRHAGTACAKCHPRLADSPQTVAAWGAARVVMRPAFARCVACHVDPHAGRFEPGGARARRDGCLGCHTLDAFRPSRYDARAHAECVFALAGAHQAAPCAACHAELAAKPATSSLAADSAAARPLRFTDARRACVDCHESPHGKQFAARSDHGACQGCHDDRAFSPASRFDHDRDARWRLDGAHRKVPCASCHPAQKDGTGRPFVVYRPTATRCEACHAGGLRDSSGIAPVAPKTRSSLLPRPSARRPISPREVERAHTS